MNRNVYHYYPIIRLKQAELYAISAIDRRLDISYTPIFEMVHDSFWKEQLENGRRQKDDNGEYLPKIPKDATSVLRKQAERLMNHCRNERPLMIDMSDLTDKIEDDHNDHPMVRFFEEVRNTSKLSMIPVSGLENKSRPRQYQEAVRSCVTLDKCRVCLRLSRSDIDAPNIALHIMELIKFWQTSRDNVIILLDLGYVHSEIDLNDYLNSIPFINDWYDIILASGAFPQNGKPVMWKPNNSYQFLRHDWTNWVNLVVGEGNAARMPNYGDYTSLHPEYMIYKTFYNPPTAKITWTLEDKWVMERGESIKTKGQFPLLANALFGQEGLEESLITGCSADDLLVQIQENKIDVQDVKGGLVSWIGYSIERHITLTILQLYDLFEQ